MSVVHSEPSSNWIALRVSGSSMGISIIFTAVDSNVMSVHSVHGMWGSVQHRERKLLLGFRGNFNGIGWIW
jgi:hypothetical protein